MLKTPNTWNDTAFWTRKLSLFAVLLLCSLGLCGANYAAFAAFSKRPSGYAAGFVLMVTGLVELVGMFVGVLGLLASALGFTIACLSGASRSDESTIGPYLHDREEDK